MLHRYQDANNKREANTTIVKQLVCISSRVTWSLGFTISVKPRRAFEEYLGCHYAGLD